MNALFDRVTKTYTGADRDLLPYEIEIQNVDLTGLTKQHPYTVKTEKSDANGKPLYLYAEENVVQTTTESVTVESTDVTDQPVMITVQNKIPLLDADGKQVSYTPTSTFLDDEGNEQTVTGDPILCFTVEEVQEQKTDEQGNKLYYKQVEQDVTTTIPLVVEEITEDDPRYVEGKLSRAMTDITLYETVKLEDNPSVFTYDDVVEAKKVQIDAQYLLQLVFYSEDLAPETFTSTIDGAHFGDGFATLEAGFAILANIALPTPAQSVQVYLEGADLLPEVSFDGETFVDASKGAVRAQNAVSALTVRITNKASARRDLRALGVLA